MGIETNYRILVVDDMASIHEDFRKILLNKDDGSSSRLHQLSASLSGSPVQNATILPPFQIDSAYQGSEGLEFVRKAIENKKPYALAFIDVQMPPGEDGVQTIKRMWELDSDIQTVICTAYAKYSWKDLQNYFGENDRLFVVKKPFDDIEIVQMACSLTRKWNLGRLVEDTLQQLRQVSVSPTPQKNMDQVVNAFKNAVAELAVVNQKLKKL